MTAPFSAPGKHPLSGRSPNAELYNRPTLIAAIAAVVGVIVGSLAPWAHAFVFSLSGLDAGHLGKATLTLGALSGVALLSELAWARAPFNPRWAVPVAWAVTVAGVACLTIALPVVIRLLTSPKESFFGLPLGPEVGWGLWLLTVSSAVPCVTAAMVATEIAKNIELLQPPGQSTTSWANGWRWVAIMTSAVIAIAGTAYFSYNWKDKSLGSGPSPSEYPSFPSFPAQPTGSATPQVPQSPTSTSTPPPAPSGDLNVGIPMSHPACDGTGIVVLGNAITPGRYQADVARLLAANPGASYLRTDKSCPSLRQATEEGNPIYAVYRVAEEVCNAVRAAGGGAYGKLLDNTTDPGYIIPC
jgi:hypothetical protein